MLEIIPIIVVHYKVGQLSKGLVCTIEHIYFLCVLLRNRVSILMAGVTGNSSTMLPVSPRESIAPSPLHIFIESDHKVGERSTTATIYIKAL